MATKKKLLQAAAGSAGGAGGLDITDVFSTYLYDGNSSARTITNGLDLAGDGGLVIQRGRNVASNTFFFDTERGATKYIMSASTSGEGTQSAALTAFNSDGFTTGSYGGTNSTGTNYASWTFKKQAKFFDVVTYTGTGVNGRTVSHSLDSEVGMILVKQTNASGEPWYVYHKSLGTNKRIYLNTTGAAVTSSDGFWTVAPTSTEFSVAYNGTNKEGATYVAYLFAHNDGDGGFGPSSDQDIIKCGSIVGDGTSDREINLGFEPQWLLVRRSNTGGSWALYDNMRGMIVGGADPYLLAQSTSAEDSDQNYFEVTPNGFKVGTAGASGSAYNESGDTYIYMAIRRGPLAPPEDATEVFAPDFSPNSNNPRFISGFVTDLGMQRRRTSSGVDGFDMAPRLTQGKYMQTGSTNAEATTSTMDFDFMNGFDDDGDSSNQFIGYMWKRAPGYFDVVCWNSENTSNRRLEHNLTVIPEMVWVKSRDYVDGWYVYHKDIGSNGFLSVNTSTANTVTSALWPSPSATEFGIRENAIWNTGTAMIGYFFATLAGISKVGSFTGNGSSQTINCGFTSGARFILIKRTDSSGNWVVFDSLRGIGSGNSPYLLLNDTQAEVSNIDVVDPDSSGFIINQETQNNLNVNGGNYIFYAIA